MPTSAAIFASIPSTLIFTGADGALVSSVSIATTDAPTESPTKRIPGGPNVMAPADVNETLPAVNSTVAGAGSRAARTVTASAAIKHTAMVNPIDIVVRRI